MNSLFSLLLKLWETFGLFYMIRFVCRYCWSCYGLEWVKSTFGTWKMFWKGNNPCGWEGLRGNHFLFSEIHSKMEPLEGLFRTYQLHRALSWSVLQMHWVLKCKRDLFLLGYRSLYLPRIGSLSLPTLEIPYCTQGGVLYRRHTAYHWAAPLD